MNTHSGVSDGLRSLLAHQNIDDMLMEVVWCFMQKYLINVCIGHPVLTLQTVN